MKKLIWLFLLSGLFLSCDDFLKYNVEITFDQTAFNNQRQQWMTSNVKNYKYQLLASGFIGYDGQIIVENKKYKESITDDDINSFKEYSTIDEIYNTIETIYISNNNKMYSKNEFYFTEIYVEYDNINHIPVKINYKYYAPSNLAVDGTFDYEIKSFVKINDGNTSEVILLNMGINN
jgi:hypothetical protein